MLSDMQMLELLEDVAEWRVLFNKINADCFRDGELVIPLTDTEFYAEQIWNLTDEGDLSEARCKLIAKMLAE